MRGERGFGVLYRVCHWLVRRLLDLTVDVTVHGLEHVPPRGAALLAVNHVSALDPVLVGAAVARPVWYMAKEELFRRRLLGPLIRALHAFPVRRHRAGAATVRRALGLLREGEAVLIFPEGTRQDGVTLGPVRPGVAVLAARAGAPVIPVYHEGAARILPRGARWPRRHPVVVCFGPPLHPPAAVLRDTGAAEAFGQHLRQEWDRLRAWAAEERARRHPTRAGDPAPVSREEVRSV